MIDDMPLIWSFLVWALIALLCISLGGPWWLLMALPIGAGLILPFLCVVILELMRNSL